MTTTSDMRMDRPAKYDRELQIRLISQLQNPHNREAIAKVLDENPEMAEKLHEMIREALIINRSLDFYRMQSDTYEDIYRDASYTSKKIINMIINKPISLKEWQANTFVSVDVSPITRLHYIHWPFDKNHQYRQLWNLTDYQVVLADDTDVVWLAKRQ